MEKRNYVDTDKILTAIIIQLEKDDNDISRKLIKELNITKQYHTVINKLFTNRIEERKKTIELNNQKKEEVENKLKLNLNKLLKKQKSGDFNIDNLTDINITETKNWISINETNNSLTNSFIERANVIDFEFNEWYSSLVYFAVNSVIDDSRFDAIVRLVYGGTLIALGLTGNIALGAGAAIISIIILYQSEKDNLDKSKLSKLDLEIHRYKTALQIIENINNMSSGWIKILSN